MIIGVVVALFVAQFALVFVVTHPCMGCRLGASLVVSSVLTVVAVGLALRDPDEGALITGTIAGWMIGIWGIHGWYWILDIRDGRRFNESVDDRSGR